jgi:hypothetical protein
MSATRWTSSRVMREGVVWAAAGVAMSRSAARTIAPLPLVGRGQGVGVRESLRSDADIPAVTTPRFKEVARAVVDPHLLPPPHKGEG